jgi:hypothetical protein
MEREAWRLGRELGVEGLKVSTGAPTASGGTLPE